MKQSFDQKIYKIHTWHTLEDYHFLEIKSQLRFMLLQRCVYVVGSIVADLFLSTHTHTHTYFLIVIYERSDPELVED